MSSEATDPADRLTQALELLDEPGRLLNKLNNLRMFLQNRDDDYWMVVHRVRRIIQVLVGAEEDSEDASWAAALTDGTEAP